MQPRPLIGMTSSYIKKSLNSEGVYIHQDYHKAVIEAGGIPVILPAADKDTMQKYAEMCSGMILSGGEDIDPSYFGEKPHPKLGTVFPDRDEAEVYLIRLLLQQKKPLLAICRGIQVLNVVCGGTLTQDISSEIPEAIEHSQTIHRSQPTHTVSLTDSSRLREIFGADVIHTNSLHHQSIKTIGHGLKAAGFAPDGIIEAVEMENHPFLVGLQWHPESMVNDPGTKRLFHMFIKKAADYKIQ